MESCGFCRIRERTVLGVFAVSQTKIPERMLRHPYGVRTIRSEAIARPQSQRATLIAKASFAFLLFRGDAWAFLKCLWSPAIPSFVARPPPFMLLFDLKESVVSKFSGVVKPHRQAITVVSWLQLAEGLHPFSFFFHFFVSCSLPLSSGRRNPHSNSLGEVDVLRCAASLRPRLWCH